MQDAGPFPAVTRDEAEITDVPGAQDKRQGLGDAIHGPRAIGPSTSGNKAGLAAGVHSEVREVLAPGDPVWST